MLPLYLGSPVLDVLAHREKCLAVLAHVNQPYFFFSGGYGLLIGDDCLIVDIFD